MNDKSYPIYSENAGSDFIAHKWSEYYKNNDFEMAAIDLFDEYVSLDESEYALQKMAKAIKYRPKLALYLGRELPNKTLEKLIKLL